MAKDYSIFYKREYSADGNIGELSSWDFLLTAFNTTDRVRHVYDKVNATTKRWIVHNEYDLSSDKFPPETSFTSTATNEADFIHDIFEQLKQDGFNAADSTLCIDITGFMRPHLLFLLRYLHYLNVKKFDAFYSEPARYLYKERTAFSAGAVADVRQIRGYEGALNTDTSNDVIIVGVGYDDTLLAEVSEDKDKAEKILLFSLPSLRPDMYQESVLQAQRAVNSVGEASLANSSRLFAPANDPFVTATILSEIVEKRSMVNPISNLYLSPLATKAQTLGFGLFFLGECIGNHASMVFPFSSKYTSETSAGISRIWQYTVEFPLT